MSDNPLFKRTIVRHDIPSQHLPERTRSIRVYLPPGFQQWISYPVIYCQDGEDFFNFGRIATQAQRLIIEDGWDPFIVVGVDVDKTHRTDEYAPDGARHASYVRFFVEEMIPWVESHYPVRDEAGERVLAGDSLGGTVSMSIALQYPNRFENIISLSGAYYPPSIEQLKQAESLSHLRVWMTVGLQERAYETDRGIFDFVTLNRSAREVLSARGAKLIYSEKDGEHKWGFWQKELPEALGAFLAPAPPAFE